MQQVIAIVEGDGEVAAVPVLLRRLAEWLTPGLPVRVLTPIRVYKDRFLNRQEEFSRHLQLAASKCGNAGWVLVILDADDDCPAAKGHDVLQKARTLIPHRRVAVVLANREYEAWFIASARSLDGVRGFKCEFGDEVADAEIPRNAKGWMSKRMTGSYGEMTDQPAFTARMSLSDAHARSRSFRKLCEEWTRNMAAHDNA